MNETKTYFLYAEDDEDDRILFSNMVGKSAPGMEISFVHNGFEAIEFLQAVAPGAAYPAVIVLDLNMPRLNGLETLQLLRSDDIYRLIPVILFTITPDQEVRTSCSRLGADFVSKPETYEGWNSMISKVTAFMDR